MLAEALAAPPRIPVSPFAVTGPALIEIGYSAIPIAPGDKIPGSFTGGEWRMMREWQKFCGQLPPAFQARTWASWPNAGVGIALGRGLVAVDIDLDDAVNAVCAALPPAQVAKKGAKGLTLFFRGDTSKIQSRAFRIGGIGAVDLLSHGKQSVLPPSIHPKTGRPYEWMSIRPLGEVPLAELTEAPDNLADLIADALKPFGYKAESTFEWDGAVRESESQSSDFFRRLNEDALANLDAWVPKLGLFKANRDSGGGWRAVPHWRPSSTGQPANKRKTNLSLDPRGIRDFGDSKSYTPLNVVMCACDLGNDLDTAAKWLGEWIGYNFAPTITLVAGPSAPSRAAEKAVAAPTRKLPTEVPAAVIGVSEPAPALDDVEDAEPVALSSAVRLADLTRPPGLVGDLVDWIEASAEYPSRELALGAALGWVATLGGRGFETPTRARTNLYMVALAPSGFGKDHAGSCIMSLAQQVGLERFLGPARFMSASALRESLIEQPTILAIQDEFGGIIRQIDGPKVGIHNELIRLDMLALFSRAKDFYAGAAYAQTRAVKLFNPNLSIYGMSTPDDFWSALSSARAADGFLPRFLLFNVEGAKPARVVPRQSSGKAPHNLIDASRAIYQSVYGAGNLAGNLAGKLDGTFPQAARCVSLTADAEAALGHLEAKIEAAEGKVDLRQAPILNRTREHALKLALTIAIGVNPARPVIDETAMRWGCEAAWLSTCILAGEIERHVSDNDRQRDFKRVIEIVAKEGDKGIPLSILVRKLGGTMDKRRREELIDEAQQTKRIEIRLHRPPVGRPGARFFVC